MSPSDLQGAAIVTALFGAIIVAAEIWSRRGNPPAEWTRKFVHIGGGIACLLFPFLIRSPWVVLALAIVMSGLFAVGARLKRIRSLHGVQRKTRGSEYYPLAVFLVFWFSGGEPWLYVSSVLVLAVADASAALVGSHYGSIRYTVEDETKSVEGSVIFFLIAFLVIHLSLLLLEPELPRETCVLAALLVAILATMLEAISLGGADNLIVPIGTCLILKRITEKPVEEVLYQIGSLMVISAVVGLLGTRSRVFNVGGTLTFLLFTYAAWSLGSEEWALPILLGFAVYLSVWRLFGSPERYARIVRVRLVSEALTVPFLVLVIDNAAELDGLLYGPFLASAIGTLTMGLWSHVVERVNLARMKYVVASLVGAGSCLAVAVIPWSVQQHRHYSSLLGMLAVSIALAVVNARVKQQREQPLEDDEFHKWRSVNYLILLAAACALFTLQTRGWIERWYPGEASLILR